MKFDSILNKHLTELNVPIVEGVLYEQFSIVEKKGFYYVFNEKRDKIIWHGKTINEAKEYINSINSGC